MIEVCKILHNYYMILKLPQNKSSTTLNNASVTRGNSLKLLNQSFHKIYEVFIPCSCG